MAFFDDRQFLLSHIHHSFITCDDTGMCEMVMLNELITDKSLTKTTDTEDCENDEQIAKVLDYYSSFLDSELLEAGQSVDIVSDMALIGAHRHRSNTAQRLERLKKEKQLQAKIKHVQWKKNSDPLSESEKSELFPKKENIHNDVGPRKSALAEAIERHPAVPNNPFNEYTRFDGKNSRGAPTKRIAIYLTMLPPKERAYPMEVVCLPNARVHDLIGLICWQYTNVGREPKLHPNVANYSLRIAEETGEVDEDFPSLDSKEMVAKFGFPVLALVERNTAESVPLITIHIEDEFTKIEVPNLDVTLRDVIEQIQKRRKWFANVKSFYIERLDNPGSRLSLESRLSDLGSLEFQIVKADSASQDLTNDDWDMQQMTAMEAPLYQSYIVTAKKVARSYDVQMGISGEKVEINPLPQSGAIKIVTRQQRPATYYMDTIAACEMVPKKYNAGKSVFRIVRQNGTEFKHYSFEANNQTAQEIVKKLQVILDMSSNTACKEYQQLRERKLQKKLHRNSQRIF